VNATAAAATRSTSRLWIIAILGALGMFALYFIVRSALPYFNVSREHYGPYFWPRRWMLILHIIGGIAALTTGLVQLWLGLTNRVARLHRALGKMYVGVILVGSIAGFYLALTIPSNVPYASGLFFLCVAWVITTAMALIAVLRRNFPQHREWMLRSYAVTFAFVTFRFGFDLLTSQGVAPAEAQGTMAWACWAIPLLLLEPMLQLSKVRRSWET
jgi:uncharacterized membrane protein